MGLPVGHSLRANRKNMIRSIYRAANTLHLTSRDKTGNQMDMIMCWIPIWPAPKEIVGIKLKQ